jgi:hypothetical protein
MNITIHYRYLLVTTIPTRQTPKTFFLDDGGPISAKRRFRLMSQYGLCANFQYCGSGVIDSGSGYGSRVLMIKIEKKYSSKLSVSFFDQNVQFTILIPRPP